MEFTDELKNKLNEAETFEEGKAIIEEAGLELPDELLEEIAGGNFWKDLERGSHAIASKMGEQMDKAIYELSRRNDYCCIVCHKGFVDDEHLKRHLLWHNVVIR